jgi:hypothetical protein
MIGRDKTCWGSQECPEGFSVVDLSFQFGIGIDVVPLLKEEAFKQDKRMKGLIPFVTFSDGIVYEKDHFYGLPIDSGANIFHSIDGHIPVAGVSKGEVGKSQIGVEFFEAHSSSRLMNFKELWQQN